MIKPYYELKLCPFCGTTAKIQRNEDWPDCSRKPYIWFTIGCITDGCICEVDAECQAFEIEKEAIKAWNSRTEAQRFTPDLAGKEK